MPASGEVFEMRKIGLIKFLIFGCVLLSSAFGVFAQQKNSSSIKSQEISESDGVPVLV